MKIAVVAVLAGLMMTVAIIATVTAPRQAASASAAAALPSGDRHAAETEHCRQATEPDAQCDAVWSERRRRFFEHEGGAK